MTSLRWSLFLSFAEKYSVLLINIVATVILARLLTPVETGLYSVAAGIVSIAQTMRDFGVGSYIVQEHDLTRARLASALAVSLVLGIGIAAIFVASAGWMAVLFHEPRLKTVILVLSLNFVFVAIASIGTARINRDMNFRASMRIGVVSAAVHAATSILLAARGYGAVGMAWASVMGILVNLVGNYICYAADLTLIPSLREWRRVVRFGVPAGGGYILQEAGQRAPDIIVGRLLGFAAAGLFSRANGLITLFEQALMSAITPVALSALARLSRNREELRAPFLKFLSYTTVVAWPFLAMMAVLALPIIRVAFGTQWLAAVEAARFLCGAAALATIARAAIILFTAIGTVKRLFAVQLVVIPIQVTAMAIGATHSIEAAAQGTLLSSLVLVFLSLQQVNRAIATSWRQIGAELGISLAATLATVAVPVGLVWAFPLSPEHFWPQTLAAGIGAAGGWAGYLRVTRHPFWNEILVGHAGLWAFVRTGRRVPRPPAAIQPASLTEAET